jgi:DNA-binding NarL/FixJ family response regulator
MAGSALHDCAPFRILIVDDDPLVRRALERTLRAVKDATVEHYGRGDDALARMREVVFDLAILDLQMPEMDGVDVARRLRVARPEIRLLFITADTASGLANEARKIESDGMFPKPWPSAELLQIIRGIQASRSSTL